MTLRRRSFTRFLIVLLAGVALTGCSPEPESRVAVRYLGDGRVEVLAVVCQGYRGVRVAVFEDRSEGGGAVWAVVPPVGAQPAARTELLRVPLFVTPAGWETQENSLTGLSAGVLYGVSFSSIEGRLVDMSFTLEKLERLGNRVLFGPPGHERAISESEFVEAASSLCDRHPQPVDSNWSGPLVVTKDGDGLNVSGTQPWETP